MKKVLLVYKKSVLEFIEKNPDTLKHLQDSNKNLYNKFVRADAQHRKSLDKVLSVLEKHQWNVKKVFRSSFKHDDNIDLVVSVGGDGTLLESARYNKSTPILGVNSDPKSSVAFFSACNATTFENTLKKLGTREVPLKTITRLQTTINGKPLKHMILNDILLSHRNPAHSTRFILNRDGQRIPFKCSGIWVSTAAGSTAAIGSAGGKRLALTSKRWQFLVREPYGSYDVTQGLLKGDESLHLTCNMENTYLYFDGPHTRHKLYIGDEIMVSPSPYSLKLYRS